MVVSGWWLVVSKTPETPMLRDHDDGPTALDYLRKGIRLTKLREREIALTDFRRRLENRADGSLRATVKRLPPDAGPDAYVNEAFAAMRGHIRMRQRACTIGRRDADLLLREYDEAWRNQYDAARGVGRAPAGRD